jgi:hypothetical protein
MQYLNLPKKNRDNHEILINNNGTLATDVDIAKLFSLLYNDVVCCADKTNKTIFTFDKNTALWDTDERFNGVLLDKLLTEDFLDQITICLDPICEELKKKSIKIDTLTKFIKRLKEPDETKIAELSGLNYDFNCSTVQKLKCNTGIAKIFNRICVNLDNRDIENTLNRKPGVMAIGNKKVINLDTLIVTDRVQSDNFSHCTKTKYIENFDPNSDEYKFCERYYLDLFCNDIEVLQTYLNIMKTSMYGKKIRNFFLIYGPDKRN